MKIGISSLCGSLDKKIIRGNSISIWRPYFKMADTLVQ